MKVPICICTLLFWGSLGLAAETPTLQLTELEQTKLQLNAEKQRSNAEQAELIHQAFQKNLDEAGDLRKGAKDLHDSICRAHGLDPVKCNFNPEQTQIIQPPAPPPPDLKPTAGPAPPKAK